MSESQSEQAQPEQNIDAENVVVNNAPDGGGVDAPAPDAGGAEGGESDGGAEAGAEGDSDA